MAPRKDNRRPVEHSAQAQAWTRAMRDPEQAARSAELRVAPAVWRPVRMRRTPTTLRASECQLFTSTTDDGLLVSDRRRSDRMRPEGKTEKGSGSEEQEHHWARLDPEPTSHHQPCRRSWRTLHERSEVVRPARLERATSWFVARRSIQLSYGRVRSTGISPVHEDSPPSDRISCRRNSGF